MDSTQLPPPTRPTDTSGFPGGPAPTVPTISSDPSVDSSPSSPDPVRDSHPNVQPPVAPDLALASDSPSQSPPVQSLPTQSPPGPSSCPSAQISSINEPEPVFRSPIIAGLQNTNGALPTSSRSHDAGSNRTDYPKKSKHWTGVYQLTVLQLPLVRVNHACTTHRPPALTHPAVAVRLVRHRASGRRLRAHYLANGLGLFWLSLWGDGSAGLELVAVGQTLLQGGTPQISKVNLTYGASGKRKKLWLL